MIIDEVLTPLRRYIKLKGYGGPGEQGMRARILLESARKRASAPLYFHAKQFGPPGGRANEILMSPGQSCTATMSGLAWCCMAWRCWDVAVAYLLRKMWVTCDHVPCIGCLPRCLPPAAGRVLSDSRLLAPRLHRAAARSHGQGDWEGQGLCSWMAGRWLGR